MNAEESCRHASHLAARRRPFPGQPCECHESHHWQVPQVTLRDRATAKLALGRRQTPGIAEAEALRPSLSMRTQTRSRFEEEEGMENLARLKTTRVIQAEA